MSLLAQSNRPALSHLLPSRQPMPSSAMQRVVWTALLWLQRRRTRIQLRDLPPHVLHDIGITPDDARLEIEKPFWRP